MIMEGAGGDKGDDILSLSFENLSLEDKHKGAFEGFTLFLPAVSVGNVGQLATDLLLANIPENCSPVKIGRFFHHALEPVVGTDIQGSPPGLMSSCEVFLVQELKYVIIHFHAPVTMKGRVDFVNCLINWINAQKFAQVVCFSSIFAADRIDPQLVGIPFRFLATDCVHSDLVQKFRELEWKELERREFPAPAVIEGSRKESKGEGILHLPGGGITKMLYEECLSKNIPFLALIMFASEGDNTPEALTLFQMADSVFNLRSSTKSTKDGKEDISPGGRERLVVPISWRHFGEQTLPSALY